MKNIIYLKIVKLWKNRWIFRSIFSSIFFNFYYLPFRQAVFLPILLYKPHFIDLKGTIIINSSKIKFGMIILGKYNVPLYPNSGITFQNCGGKIIFKGKCSIGNNSTIAIGEKGILEINNNFNATTSLKLVAFHKVTIEEEVLIGWNCTICDTDFHQLRMTDTNIDLPAYAPIKIEKNCWLAQNCIVQKGTMLPSYCIAATNSLLNKKYEIPNYSLIAGQPATLKKCNIYRDPKKDNVIYQSIENI